MKKWICLLAFVCTLGVAVLAAGIHSKAQAKPDDTILEGVNTAYSETGKR